MRLLTPTLVFSVATLFTNLLLFSQCCNGAGNDRSSSTSGIADPPRTGPLIQQRVRAGEYMGLYLKPIERQIRNLDRSSEQQPPRPLDPALPFYERRIPLFSIEAYPQTVAQALRDYGNVGIVDFQNQDARWIELQDGTLKQAPFEKVGEVLKTFTLGLNIHWATKAVWGQVPAPPMRDIDINGLPHFQDMPIMTLNYQDAGILYAASFQGRRAFWYPRSPHKYMLIDLRSPSIYRDLATRDEKTKQINEIMNSFESWREKYGRGLAGLQWGRPLHLDEELVRAQPKKPTIYNYIRLGSHDATRQQMVDALKEHGRFRLYLNSPGQPDERYKVKLETASTSRQGPHLSISIQPLTKTKKLQERLQGIGLPARVEHVAEEMRPFR